MLFIHMLGIRDKVYGLQPEAKDTIFMLMQKLTNAYG
jgi:hypothetical protein